MSMFGRSYGQHISGAVRCTARKSTCRTVGEAIDAGLAYVTEDRKSSA